jgi:phosphoenolpyruvate carboxykinase (GTP)
MSTASTQRPTHRRLAEWVDGWASVLQPERVQWCDGSHEEYERLCAELVASGTFTALAPDLRPGSFWARSDPGDVARVEDRTFICSERADDAGPTNNWRDPSEMRAESVSSTPTCAMCEPSGPIENGTT